jgi:5-methylcytosine-specific restriction endonuclease McrA
MPAANRTYKNNLRFRRWAFGQNRIMLCHYCNEPMTFEQSTADHMVAMSDGGDDSQANKVLSCRTCNRKKGVMRYHEFMQLLADDKKIANERRAVWKRLTKPLQSIAQKP